MLHSIPTRMSLVLWYLLKWFIESLFFIIVPCYPTLSSRCGMYWSMHLAIILIKMIPQYSNLVSHFLLHIYFAHRSWLATIWLNWILMCLNGKELSCHHHCKRPYLCQIRSNEDITPDYSIIWVSLWQIQIKSSRFNSFFKYIYF